MTIQLGFAQSVDFDLFKYNQLNFRSTKSEIINKLGKPIKIFEPEYECGFLSAYEQSTKYITYEYQKVKLTGNSKEKYLIELINFEKNNSIILNYGEYELSCETDLARLTQIFGKKIIPLFGGNLNGGVIIFNENGDDGIRIEIRNGKLIRFEYWSPC